MSRDMIHCLYCMIKSFKHRGLKRLYDRGDRSKVAANMVDKIETVLAALEIANQPEDLGSGPINPRSCAALILFLVRRRPAGSRVDFQGFTTNPGAKSAPPGGFAREGPPPGKKCSKRRKALSCAFLPVFVPSLANTRALINRS